ncbi:MAG TPA: metallophosphoesterase [Paenibacillus sp.]|jgi:3',5'-cyclic AMP phosphodiesterase CpdA
MKLAIIGDLHYPDELTNRKPSIEEARDAYYGHFMDMFLSIHADYHISVGDVTHAGEFTEFNYIMGKIESSKLRGRFLHVLGNHDTYTHPKKDILAITHQQRYGVIEEPNAIILLLDTARENRDDWSGTIDEEQLVWLEKQLSRKTDKPLFVFGHHPPYGTTARSTEQMMSLDPTLDIWPLLEQWQGIGFYFNGHNHIHSIIRKENWHFIQTAAVPDVPAVRIVTVLDNEVRLETVSMANEQLTEWASAFTGNMFDYEKYPNAEGDRAAVELIVSRLHSERKRVEHK